jgi:hypothetical protein
MFWCEVCTIYTLIKYPCNYHDVILNKTMWFLCIKHEHSRMSFKNNVSFIWIFKILNTYKYHSYQQLHEIHTIFVQTYENHISHEIYTNLWSLVNLGWMNMITKWIKQHNLETSRCSFGWKVFSDMLVHLLFHAQQRKMYIHCFKFNTKKTNASWSLDNYIFPLHMRLPKSLSPFSDIDFWWHQLTMQSWT